MGSIGSLSKIKNSTKIIEAIGENIIVADENYNIIWINPIAVDLLNEVISLFDLNHIEELIGINMSHFHKDPGYQINIMKELTHKYISRINIKDTYTADIHINPIKDDRAIIGYVVMLMDVTTTVQEDRKKEKIIYALSSPILDVWDDTLAIPLLGIVDKKRIQTISEKLLEHCDKNEPEYVIIDFSGMTEWFDEFLVSIQEMIHMLTLMGIQPILAGIGAELAQRLPIEPLKVRKFTTTKVAIKHIITQEE
ncbi:STAS domain-containing protein [Ornithinibacillus xuwenensis]|uniref:STAS domain-containing protein n=1 Tax=Ornithinibacillus xuwenensis TaxID=3144668 RepID=A0ABU9XJS9_9BACI